ncbi:hypothetical protein BJV74DRAFT_858022 [Russula compacta]|nr:hypothetical protein BJV74DRAFT_858022 [Russula compacta]
MTWVHPSGPENQLLPHSFFLHHPLLLLSFAAFLLPSHHSDSHTFRSCSRSYTPALDLASIASLPTYVSCALTMALQLAPSTSQCPVKWACLSSPILSFHRLSLPFILSPLSLPHLPHVVLKHCPTAIPCIAGTAPAAPNATRPLSISCIAHMPAVVFVFSFHCFAFVPLTTLPLCSLHLIPPLPLLFHATNPHTLCLEQPL